MADKSSSELIPKGWEFETTTKKDGSLVSHYICCKTGQRFYTYEDMMRYVNYAKEARLPVYLPNFDFRKKKKNAGQSSEESAPNGNEKSWDLEKGTDIEKSLDSENGSDIENSENGTDIEKSLDSGKDTDIEKSLDSGKDTDIEKSLDSDVGESMFPKINLVEKISASIADTMPSEAGFEVEQETRQTSSEQAPVVEVPSPRIKASVLPKSFRSMKHLRPRLHPNPSLPGRARMM